MGEFAGIVTTLSALAAADALGASPADDRAVLEACDRAVVEDFYVELLNDAGSPEVGVRAARILSENWESIGDCSRRNKGREAFVAQVRGFGKLIPDLEWMIQEILQQGNRYVVRSRVIGTPTGSFLGVPPSGKSFDIMTIDIHTVENGTIMRTYHVEDWANAIRQLGVN